MNNSIEKVEILFDTYSLSRFIKTKEQSKKSWIICSFSKIARIRWQLSILSSYIRMKVTYVWKKLCMRESFRYFVFFFLFFLRQCSGLWRSTLPSAPSRSARGAFPRAHYRKNLKFIALPHLLSIWSRIDKIDSPVTSVGTWCWRAKVKVGGQHALNCLKRVLERSLHHEELPRPLVLSNQSGNCSSVSLRHSSFSSAARCIPKNFIYVDSVCRRRWLERLLKSRFSSSLLRLPKLLAVGLRREVSS